MKPMIGELIPAFDRLKQVSKNLKPTNGRNKPLFGFSKHIIENAKPMIGFVPPSMDRWMTRMG